MLRGRSDESQQADEPKKFSYGIKPSVRLRAEHRKCCAHLRRGRTGGPGEPKFEYARLRL